MDFYVQSAATALALIAKFGGSLPITRVANTLTAITGEVTQTTTAGTLTAVVLPAKATANQAVLGSLDNAVVEALTKGRVRFVLAAASNATFAPDADDLVTFESASWRVLGCTPLSPRGTPVIYKLGIMRT